MSHNEAVNALFGVCRANRCSRSSPKALQQKRGPRQRLCTLVLLNQTGIGFPVHPFGLFCELIARESCAYFKHRQANSGSNSCPWRLFLFLMSARFRFSRQDYCSAATTCSFPTSGWSVTPPRARPGQTRIVSVMVCLLQLRSETAISLGGHNWKTFVIVAA
jgi:hypothetical protein